MSRFMLIGLIVGAVAYTIPIAIMYMEAGYMNGYNDALKHAYDRGYTVQCVGKTGIYWECEE